MTTKKLDDLSGNGSAIAGTDRLLAVQGATSSNAVKVLFSAVATYIASALGLNVATPGTAEASKFLQLDANKDATSLRDLTVRQMLCTGGVGAKNGSTVAAVEYGDGVFHKTVLTCTATPVTITDDAGVAQYGGAGKLYDFPVGMLCILGAVVDGAVTLGTTGTIINTWAGGVAIGTATATTGATLTGTEADIMPEVDVAAATAKVASVDAVSVATALTESGARWLDGTGGALDAYLNLVVDDDATHTSGTGTFTGTVTLCWINLGTTA